MSTSMPSDSTCWTLIRGAAVGAGEDREDFARRYVTVVRAYLSHRWKSSPLLSELDDVAQEVFVECFRQGGVLDRIREDQPASFRAFLYGVTRNVAMRCERRIGKQRERQPAGPVEPEEVESDEATMSRVFDRAWALALFRQAGDLQEERAKVAGERAMKRVELLRLRARENLPIRDIAKLWERDAAEVHKEYARARNEFRAALEEVLSFHHPGASAAEIEEKCNQLLELIRG
ncbi:MAG: sigma-70 family RNA polymerase sigma factor [Planctomycetota bacterium]